jgi:hypothetical protein
MLRADGEDQAETLERQLITLASASIDSGSIDSGSIDSGSIDSGSIDSGTIGSGSVAIGIPTEPRGSYVLILSTKSPSIQYDVSITGIPLVTSEELKSDVATPRVAVELQAGRAARVDVAGDLTLVQGAQVLKSDYSKEWAIVRRPDDGLAILNLESTVNAGSPGEVSRTDLPAPIQIGLNEQHKLQVGSAATAQLIVGEPNVLLAAEATCGKPVDLTLIDTAAGTSASPQSGPARPVLPLKLSTGSHELLLSSQLVPETCTLSVREVDEQPINKVEPQVVMISPGEMSSAYELRFPEDVVLTAEQGRGVTASVGCGSHGVDGVVQNPDRLLAFVPADTACALWLVRSSSSDLRERGLSMQLSISQVTS